MSRFLAFVTTAVLAVLVGGCHLHYHYHPPATHRNAEDSLLDQALEDLQNGKASEDNRS